MAITQNTYTGNGSTTNYSFTFPYLETTDIKVSVNGVNTTAYTLANPTTVSFNTAPANGAAIRIYRDTDDSALAATFYPGSAIRSQDLNDNFTQNLYVVQEINNNAVQIDGSQTMVGDLDMGGYQINNLAEPTVDDDAATKYYIDQRYGSTTIPAHTRWRKTATAGQTTFSGTGDYGGTLTYSALREQVYLNGALQQRSADYTADNGTSIVFSVPLTVGDVVDVVCVNNTNTSGISNAANLSYSGQFSGQTVRTVAAKLADVVSVKDFGAGQGGANDSSKIQAAIDAASAAGGGTVYFPAGTYNLQSELSFPSNVHYKGEGKQSLLKVNSTTFFYIFNQASVDVENVVFDGLGFDGSINYPADSTVYKQTYSLGNFAIRVGGVKATNIRIQNCWFNQLAGGSIDINGMESSHIAIVDNYFYKGSYKSNVINIRLPSGTYTDNQRVSKVRVTGNHIDICGPQYHYDPTKEDWVASADAISFDSAKDCVISDNVVNLSGACGIRVEESLRVTVANNKVIKPGQEGITFYKNCYDCSCSGNTVEAWGRIPPAYAIRNYSGTYVVAREFPRAAGPTLPADPTASSWFEVWPYTLTNINTAAILTYSTSDYYTSPNVGLLPFRGYSAISVTNESERISVIGNNCLGDLTTSGGKSVYASDFGFTPVHSANDATAVSGRNCLISGNGFVDCRVYRIYHPQYHDRINLRGLLGEAVYTGNRDSSSLIYGTNSRLSQGGELIATTRSNLIANEVNFPATQIASAGANTLDDYEEGLFTAGMTADSGTITLANDYLFYTKVGRMVSVTGQITIGSVSSPSGDVYLTIPFQNATSSKRSASVDFFVVAYTLTGSPSGVARAFMNSAATQLTLGIFNNFAGLGIASNLQAGSTLTFNFTYTASS